MWIWMRLAQDWLSWRAVEVAYTQQWVLMGWDGGKEIFYLHIFLYFIINNNTASNTFIKKQ